MGFQWLNYFTKVFITNEKQTSESESICVFEIWNTFCILLKIHHSSYPSNWKTLLSSIGHCSVFHVYTEYQSTPRAILYWAVDSVLTRGVCYSLMRENLSSQRNFKLLKVETVMPPDGLTRFSWKDHIYLQLSKKPFSFLVFLYNTGAHSNMVAGWVIFPRPRGLGQTGLNHFAIDSKI